VRVANDTEYGLSGAVFGRDVPRAFNVARRLETGICHVNGATVHDEPQMPFGGVKASGFGREGGPEGIDEYLSIKYVAMAM
jgi:acyl-CoA reductase-like NAD-dependent aldehyde dehydrogenase